MEHNGNLILLYIPQDPFGGTEQFIAPLQEIETMLLGEKNISPIIVGGRINCVVVSSFEDLEKHIGVVIEKIL